MKKRKLPIIGITLCILLLGCIQIFSNSELFAQLEEAKEHHYGNMFQPIACCHIEDSDHTTHD